MGRKYSTYENYRKSVFSSNRAERFPIQYNGARNCTDKISGTLQIKVPLSRKVCRLLIFIRIIRYQNDWQKVNTFNVNGIICFSENYFEDKASKFCTKTNNWESCILIHLAHCFRAKMSRISPNKLGATFPGLLSW